MHLIWRRKIYLLCRSVSLEWRKRKFFSSKCNFCGGELWDICVGESANGPKKFESFRKRKNEELKRSCFRRMIAGRERERVTVSLHSIGFNFQLSTGRGSWKWVSYNAQPCIQNCKAATWCMRLGSGTWEDGCNFGSLILQNVRLSWKVHWWDPPFRKLKTIWLRVDKI